MNHDVFIVLVCILFGIVITALLWMSEHDTDDT